MRAILFNTVFVLILALAGNTSAADLGEDVSGWQLQDLRGKPLSLATVTKEEVTLFVVVPASQVTSLCETRERSAALALQQEVRRMVLFAGGSREATRCEPEPSAMLLRAPTEMDGEARAVAMLVDDALHLRWKAPVTLDAAGWQRVEEAVNTWLLGRQSFEANCGHCHGLDGAQASSPDVKTLVGITKKYPEQRVLHLGAQFGGVDMTGWSDAKKETLLVYIRGL